MPRSPTLNYVWEAKQGRVPVAKMKGHEIAALIDQLYRVSHIQADACINHIRRQEGGSEALYHPCRYAERVGSQTGRQVYMAETWINIFEAELERRRRA